MYCQQPKALNLTEKYYRSRTVVGCILLALFLSIDIDLKECRSETSLYSFSYPHLSKVNR